jgi:uncharacterized protein with GYD domain
MARYLVQASYTAEALAAFVSKPQDRVAGVRALAERMNGQLESFDYCLGDHDVAIIVSVPDDIAAVAVALAASAPGHLKTYKTTKLIAPDEFMEACRRASGVNYQGPARG